MWASKIGATAAVVAATAIVGVSGAAPSGASDEWGINGTFATSANGDWAKINERYENQPSIGSTWAVSTSCTSPTDCAGTVSSDEGWTAPIYTTNGLWYIKRAVPQWRFCADGTPIEGLETHKLYPVGADAHVDLASTEYTGEVITVGASGSCGRNQWPTIRMPFYMKKL